MYPSPHRSSATPDALGGGFRHHGIATPISNHRGIVATRDGQGRNVALVWLFDHRGGYGLLMIDAETGASETFATPFACDGDCPFTSLLSSRNRYYTHFNSHFVEFDPCRRAFTFTQATTAKVAMSMTEDDQGRIWTAIYPDSAITVYDPNRATFHDFGSVNNENWMQYPRFIAADAGGWIYVAIGNTASQVVCLDPQNGQARPLLEAAERDVGMATVYRDINGKVYALPRGQHDQPGYECYQGTTTRIGPRAERVEKPFVSGSQGLFHDRFPDGCRLRTCDLVERILEIERPIGGATHRIAFDYETEGAHLMGLAVAPDGTICGGTAFPMRFFQYDPRRDTWANRACLGQWNCVARQGDRFFIGAYIEGMLLEWDPAQPWAPTEKRQRTGNPCWLTECEPSINRPHALLAHPDGKTLVLAGTPGYGHTGGGLLFWDRATGQGVRIDHQDLLPDHSTMSLAALPDGRLLGGSTIAAGTGGEIKATQAELYILDPGTRTILWHAPVIPGMREFTTLCPGPRSLIYGLADARWFFVFDPAARRVIHQADTLDRFGPIGYQQGPRCLLPDAGDVVYALFTQGIVQIDPNDFSMYRIADAPVPIGPGGDILNGRLYFAAGSHLYSYELPQIAQEPDYTTASTATPI